MRIIDAHHHIWIPEQTEPDIGYGWLRDIGAMKPFGDPTPIQRDYEFKEFCEESSQHELVGSVFLQTDGALADPVKETLWAADVLGNSDLLHAIVSFIDLDNPNASIEIDKHKACGMLRGVRQIVSRLDDQPGLSFAPKHYLQSSVWTDNLAILADNDLSFDLQLYPEQMRQAADVFSRWPEIPIIVDHTGSPWNASSDGFERWKLGISTLSELPNCTIKLSGFGMFNPQWSAASIAPMLLHCINTFGSSRMMFGSNFPVDKLMASYDEVVNRISDALWDVSEIKHPASDELLNDVFYATAKRVYRLG